MKKRFTAVLCLILALGCLLCLSACGGSEEPVEETAIKQYVTGRYEIQSITWDDGTTLTGDLLQEQVEIMGDTFVELYEDGTATLCLMGLRLDMQYSESKIWKDDNGLYTYEFSVKDGKATLRDGDSTYVFVKK